MGLECAPMCFEGVLCQIPTRYDLGLRDIEYPQSVRAPLLVQLDGTTMNLHANVCQSHLPKKPRQAASHRSIAVRILHRCPIGVIERVPRRMRRVNEVGSFIPACHGDDPARLRQMDHLGKQSALISRWHVDQHKPLVHQIERGWAEITRECIPFNDRHVAQAAARNFVLCHGGEFRLTLDPDNLALRSNTLREQIHCSYGTASHVGDRPPRTDTDRVEHPLRLRPQVFGLQEQSI